MAQERTGHLLSYAEAKKSEVAHTSCQDLPHYKLKGLLRKIIYAEDCTHCLVSSSPSIYS